MTKSSTPKVAAERARHTRRETNSKVAAETALYPDCTTASVAGDKVQRRRGALKETAPKLDAERARHTRRETNSKIAAEKAHGTDSKTASGTGEKVQQRRDATPPKVTPKKARATVHKVAFQVASEKALDSDTNSANKLAAEKSHDADRKATADFGQLRSTQVPASMSALAQRNVAQARELYDGSAKALKTVFESWENSIDAFGQSAVALNRTIIDIAERNISSGFDLATSLAEAQNIAEAMEVQIAYCRQQFVELRMQAEEMRVLLQKVSAGVL